MKFLPFTWAVSGALAVISAIAGFLFAGGAGALGAAAGVLFVAVAYTVSTAFIVWTEKISRPMMLPAALLAFVVKLCALASILRVLSEAGWAGWRPMAFGVGAAVLVWIIAQAVWLWRAKIPYVEV